ncbi:MAG: ATP-binding protein [Marinobacterium sp.]|nr:ATP-binding protein [Marinobacterium sp.]
MTEDESRPAQQRVSLAGYLVRLSILAISILSLLSVLLVAGHLRSSLEQTQTAMLEREATLLQQILRNWLADRQSALTNSATALTNSATELTNSATELIVPVLTQDQHIVRQLRNIHLPEVPTALYLFDMEGQLLADQQIVSRPLPVLSETVYRQLLENEQVVRLVGSTAQALWQLAVLVRHEGQGVAVLLAEIPVQEMERMLAPGGYFQDAHLRLQRNGLLLASFGTPLPYAQGLSYAWPELNVTLHYELSPDVLDRPFSGVVQELLLLGGLVGVLLGGVSYLLGRYWLVVPVQKLQQAVSAFTAGDHAALHHHRISHLSARLPRELYQLEQNVRWLAASMHKRERVLQLRNQQLEGLMNDLNAQQARLIQSERMASIGTLSAGVAHEVNNPLGFVKSNIATLDGYIRILRSLLSDWCQHRDDPALAERVRSALAKAEQQDDLVYLLEDLPDLLDESHEGIERIERIIAALKTFSDSNQERLSEVDLTRCISSALTALDADLKPLAKVETALSPLPPIRAVQAQLDQVVLHLLRNAIQAMESLPDREHLRIQAWVDKEDVVLQVEDNGSGIAEADLGRVFTPFYTTRPVGKGAGLGLSISHNIITSCHGSIELQSEQGKGTCVTVRLPAIQRVAGKSHRVTGAQPALAPDVRSALAADQKVSAENTGKSTAVAGDL